VKIKLYHKNSSSFCENDTFS